MELIKEEAKRQLAEEIRLKIRELNTLLRKAKKEDVIVDIIDNNYCSIEADVFEVEIYEKNKL